MIFRRSVMIHNQFPPMKTFKLWCFRRKISRLMTHRHGCFSSQFATPCTNRLEIIDHQIILMDRKIFNIIIKLFHMKTVPSFAEIDTSFAAKNKSKSVELILNLVLKSHFGLCSTDKDINFSVLFQIGKNFSGAAYMAISGSLECV